MWRVNGGLEVYLTGVEEDGRDGVRKEIALGGEEVCWGRMSVLGM